MSTNIQKKADHIQLAPWHLSPREISLIEPCRDLWLEVQKNNRPHGMYKIQEMLSEGVDEGERNAATLYVHVICGMPGTLNLRP